MNDKPQQRQSRPREREPKAPANAHTNQRESETSEQPLFPMRINKYLALEGRGSRREMDKIVAEGKVTINGREAVLGDKVNEGDKVEIRFRASRGKF